MKLVKSSFFFMLFVPLITLGKEEECNLDGLCVSFLLEVTVVLSKTECYLKCHENPDCLWFTYNYYHDQTCHLNKGCNFKTTIRCCFPTSSTRKDLLWHHSPAFGATNISIVRH